ncbi:thiosulfate oxidation carrier protein SoxY [Magnetococcales bacterium HHB-1]
MKYDQQGMTRRGFFKGVGSVGLTAAVATAMPTVAKASPVEEAIQSVMGATSGTEGKVSFDADMPNPAQNGKAVRVPFSVDHPMEEGNYIQTVAIFVDDNPIPLAARFDLTPEAGEAAMEVRIKIPLPGEHNVRILAKNSKGELFQATKKVKVIGGGCVG